MTFLGVHRLAAPLALDRAWTRTGRATCRTP